MSIDDPLTSSQLDDLMRRLRQSSERVAHLQRVSEALGEAQSDEAVVQAILREGVAALGARGGAVARLEGDRLKLIGTSGYPEVDALVPFDSPLGSAGPLTWVAEHREALFLRDRGEIVMRFPVIDEHHYFAPDQAVAVVPLVLDAANLGALAFSFAEPRQFEQEERDFIRALGQHAAQAFDRLHLAAKGRAAQQRQEFLSRASAILGSSLDYNSTLQQVARLIVPTMADWCAVDILTGPTALHRVATAHVDPAKVVWARELEERYPVDLDAADGLPHVLRSGEPLVIPVVTAEMLAAGARDAEQLEMIRQIGFSSVMIVPLTARGRTFGAVTLVAAESGYHYDDNDLAFAKDLADRAALAIDNARLFRDAQQHAARASARAEVTRTMVAAGLNRAAVIDSLVRAAREQIGDAVVVRLLSDDGQWLRAVASAHPDPEAARMLEEMIGAVPLRISEGFNAVVVATGKPLNLPAKSQPGVPLQLHPEYEGYRKRYGLQCMLIVPLQARGQLVGTLALFRDRERGLYGDDEELFAQDLADVAGLAIDNARLYEAAQEGVRAREAFLSVASHELKTPLTTIKGLGQLLQRLTAQPTLDRQRLSRLIQQLQGQTGRFQELVDDLLDVSRIQQGRLALEPQTVDLSELVREVVERFAEASERKATHRIVLDAPAQIIGQWDASRLDQVLTNLISNALKYSPGGEVHVALRRIGQQAEVVVRDEGIGISDEERAQLFQPFSRAERVRSEIDGTGLGLYISKEIVEQHGGTILVESELGCGSSFIIRLPLEG